MLLYLSSGGADASVFVAVCSMTVNDVSSQDYICCCLEQAEVSVGVEPFLCFYDQGGHIVRLQS